MITKTDKSELLGNCGTIRESSLMIRLVRIAVDLARIAR